MLTNESTIVPPTSIVHPSSLTTFPSSSTEISRTTSLIHSTSTSVSRSSVVIVTATNSTSHSAGTTSHSLPRPTSTVSSITSVTVSTPRPISTHTITSSSVSVKPNNAPLPPPMASHSDSSTAHTTHPTASPTQSPNKSPTSVRQDAVSSTKPPPPPPPPTTKPPPPSSTNVGTTTQIVTAPPKPSGTITMLTTPNSTLSNPVALTLNINGSNITSTPPLVTMISTSTDSNNGGIATITQVVANPPPIEKVTAARTGILQNSGALAGIFIVIGILVASMIIGIVWLIRRARRRARRARWLSSIQRPGPPSDHNPFQDPLGSPSMRTVNNGDNYGWSAAGQARDMRTNERLHYDTPGSAGHGNTTTSLFPDTYPILHNQNYPRPGDQYALRSMDLKPNYLVPDDAPPARPRAQFTRSIAPSTPSEYPASLPDEDDDQAHHDTQMTAANRFSSEPVMNAPPRPPRSLLRENSKIMQYKPPTPPDSILNSSTPNSPVETRSEDIFTRRTLLGVRSRAQV